MKIFALVILSFALFGCGSGKTEETISSIESRNYRIDIRSQEFVNSGIHNVDICVSMVSVKIFPNPNKGAQCFFHGFDLSGLKVEWTSENRIEIYFEDGYVSAFRNYAIIPNGLHPIEFHVSLREGGQRQK